MVIKSENAVRSGIHRLHVGDQNIAVRYPESVQFSEMTVQGKKVVPEETQPGVTRDFREAMNE